MAEGYPWVSEGSIRKYHRAVEKLRVEKKPITEEAVKELYISWGGLVLDTNKVLQDDSQEEKEIKTPRRGRPQVERNEESSN